MVQTVEIRMVLKLSGTKPHINSADCMSDILEVSGHELERNMRYKKVDVFVTSPKRVTTYHIDSESGFLLQIAGSKEQVPRPRPLPTHQPVPL